MNINCIIKNTKILAQLETLVSDIANDLISKDIVPTPSNIFNQVRNLGVEIDLTTIGAIYAKNLSGTDATFMNVSEVGKEIGADLNSTINKMMLLNKGVKEIGKRSPAEAVASAIANIFIDRNTPIQTRTMMRKMQDIVLKGLKRHIPGNPLQNSVSPLDVAREALKNMDTLGYKDIHGQLNNLEDVFNDVQKELDKQMDELEAQGASPATIAKYEEMINGVRNSIYQLMLTKTEARDIITEAIKKYKKGIFTKTDSKGNVKLDYDALSGHVKSEQDLRDNVKEALADSGFSQRDIAIITDSLAAEFKAAYTNILDKAVNKLNQKLAAQGKTVITKSDLERLAQLHALGAFGGAHKKMIYDLLGLDDMSQEDLNDVEAIADEVNRMRDAGFIQGNDRERELNLMIDHIISKARFRDANWIYKTVKVLSDILGMANLSILNNIKNRVENFVSGAIENKTGMIARGRLPKEIRGLADATKKDIISNGGRSFGEMDMLFQGDYNLTERTRQFLAKAIAGGDEGGQKVVNWWYNQIMGTAALNGVDSYNKVKNTWSRFIGNMEQLLIDKGAAKNRAEAQKILHEKMFGDKWEEAKDKARQLTKQITDDGSVLKNATPEMITRLAADIVKAELVNNNLITQDELDATWNASYKAAGRAMGHVANNFISVVLQAVNNKGQQAIRKQLDKQEYTKAAGLMLADLIVNKVALKFAGGGTNWIILNVEKAGLGLILGGIKKGFIGKQKNLSQMTPKEIEEELYQHQVQNDKIVRGAVGATINAALFTIAYGLYGGDNDEDKKRRKNLLKWTENNKWANKYLNVLPLYVTAYLAVMKQKETDAGIRGILNQHKYSPLRNFEENFTNRNDSYTLENMLSKSLAGITNNSDDDDKRNNAQRKGWEEAGKLLGTYFNFDPLPYKPFKDLGEIGQGIFGKPTKSDRDAKERAKEDGDKPEPFKNMVEGYAKFGLFDW